MSVQTARTLCWITAGLALLSARDPPPSPGWATQTPCSSAFPDESRTLDDARKLLQQGKPSESEGLARVLLAQAERAHGRRSIQAAEALDVLVQALWRGGKSREPATRELAKRAIRIKQAECGSDDPRTATSLTNLGLIQHGCGEFADEKSTHEHALTILQRSFGPDHPTVGQSLNYLAGALLELGQFPEARSNYECALAIHEKALGPKDLEVALDLNCLGGVRYFLGEYAAAESCFLRALDIREKSLGEDHLLVAGVLNNYASLRRAMGDYAGARLDYERALRIREQNLPPEHPLLASSLNNLGYLLWVSGDYAAAKPIYVRALDINEKANGPNHPSTALALGNLANLLRSMSEYAEARPLYERALRIEEAALGPSHRELAATLTAMADLHISMRNLAAALPLYERALRIQEKALGLDHPEVAITLCRLADALQANGAGPQVRLYERALAIQDKALGPRHPIEATTLNSLARLLAEVGRTDEAFEAALRAEAIGMEHLHLTARTLAEREALRYESVRASGLGLALDLVVSGEVTSPAARERAWDALIRSRAIVLDEIASRHRAVEGSSDAEIARLASSLTQARTRLANLTVRGPESLVSDVYRELLDQARAERDRAERDLAVKSLWVRQEMERERIGLAEVTKSLSDGTTLVSFALYQSRSRPKRSLASRSAARAASTSAIPERTESEDVPYYLAFVLSARQSLTVIALGPAGEIDALVSQWSKQCGLHSHPRDASRTLADYRRAGEALRHAVWDPLESTLRGAQRILVVPDGALHLVNLAALPLGDSHYLIETAPLIHYLSTERDLTRIAEQKAAGHGLLAVGGPDFEASGSSALAHGRPSQGSPAPQKDVAGRGIDTPCKDLRAPFPQLPASRREVKEIESLWSRAQGPRQDASGRRGPDALAADVVCLTDADATETAFKTLAPGRRVLHVATHGFFLGGPCLAPVSDSRGLGPPRPVGPNGITPTEISSPLLLSGLVFAGANHRDRATSNEDDAILTAEEIASLDLRDVEWVVLSACDTGVGEVRAGESVFGLRRAFQIAGARTLIMSLWSVQDEAARQWMESLYQGRFLQKLSTADAVRRASIEVLRQRRAEGQSTHPFSWAGFIAVGNWD